MKVWIKLEEYWNKVLNSGVHDDLSALDKIRVQVVNGSAVIATLSQWVLIAIRIYYKDPFDLTYVYNFLISLLAFPAIYANKQRYYGIAKSVFFFSGLILVTLILQSHISDGILTHTELILIPVSIFCILLFNGVMKNISFISIFCCYMYINISRIHLQRLESELIKEDIINPIFIFIIVYVLSSLYLSAYNKAQQMVVAKNEELINQKLMIEQQSQKLQELNNQKDKLFSIVSHDLRSPMNSLNSLMAFMNQDWITDADFRKQLPALSKTMESTSDLLNNLLNWARGQMEGEVKHKTRFDISILAANVVDTALDLASRKGIVLRSEVEQANVEADADMITIALRNLLTNAIKFSRENQTVTISSSVSNAQVVICVQDDGVGMDAEKAASIFNFSIKSTKGTSNETGTGLGLIVCKDFVEKNGGKIWVASKLGEGSSFYFTIPINKFRKSENVIS